MTDWHREARAYDEEHRREEALRNPPWFLLEGLLQPFQHKVFRIENEIEIWCTYEYKGKPVNLRVMIAMNRYFAHMAMTSLNEVQNRMAKEEAERK